MKISPMTGGGLPGINVAGQPTNLSTPDPQVDRALDVRKLRMKTNVSPDRPIEAQAPEVTEQAQSATADVNESTAEVTEATKPLSPQFAALAKQRRALQVKERELADREKALSSRSSSEDMIAKLKSQPLSVLQEHGVTYDQLTEAILSDQSSVSPELIELRSKLKALEEGVEKKFVDRETQAEQAALTEMLSEAEALIKEGDTYELVRENDKLEDVLRHIHTTYKTTGRVMDVTEALEFVENKELETAMRFANFNKVKGKLTPQQPQNPVQRQGTLKTLTNRDSASAGLSRRERALLAAQGLLPKG